MLELKPFEKVMSDAGKIRRRADSIATTALSPWPWTSEQKIKKSKKEALAHYRKALKILKELENTLPNPETEEENHEISILRQRVENTRKEIYQTLFKLTGKEKYLELSELAKKRAESLLNESVLNKRIKANPLTSGLSMPELTAHLKAEAQSMFFKSLSHEQKQAYSEALDRIIKFNNEKIGPKLLNEKIGKEVFRYENGTLKLDPSYLLKERAVIVENNGKKIAVPLDKSSAKNALENATALSELSLNYDSILPEIELFDKRLANTNFFYRLEKGPVVLDDYSDLFTQTKGCTAEELKKKLVEGTDLEWKGNALVTKKPLDKKTLKKNLRKVQERAKELSPALKVAGIPTEFSLGKRELNELFPSYKGTALATIMGYGIPPIPHKRKTYNGPVKDFEGSELPPDSDAQKDALHAQQEPQPVQHDEKINVSFTADQHQVIQPAQPEQPPLQTDPYAAYSQEVPQPIQQPSIEKKNKKPYKLKSMLVLSKDGRLIAHQPYEEEMTDPMILGGMISAVQTFIKDSMGAEDEEMEKPVLDDLTHGEHKLLISRYKGCDIVLAYTAPKKFAHKFLEPALSQTHEAIEGIYGGILEDWDGNVSAFEGISNYLDIEPRIIEMRKKDRRKKGGMAGALVVGGLLTAAGVANELSKKPATITIQEDVPATLTPVPDVNITEGQNVNITVKAAAPAGYLLQARLAWASNNTTIEEFQLAPSEGAYISQLLLSGELFPYGKSLLNLSLWRDKDLDGKYETLDNWVLFNLSKRHKINLPPEIIPKLSKIGKSNYLLEIKTQDASGDEIPGTGDVQAYLDGVLLATKKKSLKLNFSLEEEGDHELEVRAYDAKNKSLESVWKTVLHKNYRPEIKSLTIKKTAHDTYEAEIEYFDKDGTITKLPFKVSRDNTTILYQELEPQTQNSTIKVPINLTEEKPGEYSIEVHAVDNEGDISDTARAQATAENDQITFTVNSIEKVPGQNDTWSYDIDWSKPDGSAYSITVGFAQPDNQTNEQENVHINKDKTKRFGKIKGELDLSESYPVPAERDLTIKGIDEYGEATEYRAGKIISLENNRAWVWSQVVSENNNETGNAFTIKINSYDEDTATIRLLIEAERGGDVLQSYSENTFNKTISRTIPFDFSSEEPGPIVFKGYFTDSTGTKYQVFSFNVSVQDDPIDIKDTSIKYNPLPSTFGGKKFNISANLSNPDDDITSAVIKLENETGKVYEFPLALKGEGRERYIREEIDVSGLPSGKYKYYLIAQGAHGLKTVSTGEVEKNESYEIELLEPSGEEKIEWDYNKGKALLTPISDEELKAEELDDYDIHVPLKIKQSLAENWSSLVDPSDPLTTGKNLLPWLETFIPDVPGREDDKAFCRNMTAIFRYIVANMSQNSTLTPSDRALWNRSFAIPLTTMDTYYDALISCDVNNDKDFDTMNEQILLNRVFGWTRYGTMLGGGYRVTEPSYGESFDKSTATNRLLFNRYNLNWSVPGWFDVSENSEQKLCDHTDHPTPENNSMLAELEKVMITYQKLGGLEAGQKLIFQYDDARKTYRKFVKVI